MAGIKDVHKLKAKYILLPVFMGRFLWFHDKNCMLSME